MEENPLFSNVSKLDLPAVEKFNKIIGKKLTTLSAGAVIVLCAVVGGLFCIFDLFLGIATIGVGVLIGAPLVAYFIKDSMKKNAGNLLQGEEYIVHFDFYQEEILLKAERKNTKTGKYEFSGEERVKYTDIAKVIVNGTDVYLQRTGQANILDQRGMTLKTAGELLEFLASKGLKIKK